jgi:transposase InsO family protein
MGRRPPNRRSARPSDALVERVRATALAPVLPADVEPSASEFTDKTSAPNEMWKTDFTYLKIIGWGWMYLSTILDDFSRYIIAWKLCTIMKAEDVTATLTLAASGCDQAHVRHKPRPLSDNGSSLHLRRACRMARRAAHDPCLRRALPSPDPGRSSAGTRP